MFVTSAHGYAQVTPPEYDLQGIKSGISLSFVLVRSGEHFGQIVTWFTELNIGDRYFKPHFGNTIKIVLILEYARTATRKLEVQHQHFSFLVTGRFRLETTTANDY